MNRLPKKQIREPSVVINKVSMSPPQSNVLPKKQIVNPMKQLRNIPVPIVKNKAI
jgi:hypothetical protein